MAIIYDEYKNYEKEMDAPENWESDAVFYMTEDGEMKQINVPDDKEGGE